MTTDLAILVTTLVAGAALFSRRVRESTEWRATVTPLASIIGSGFLVVVPLFGRAEGLWAVPAMFAIVALAYALGGVVRHNIRYVEPCLEQKVVQPPLLALERLSAIALILAYLISVTFYVRILSAFLLEGIAVDGLFRERVLTSAVLTFVGVVGWTRGLGALEQLEKFSVNAKLAVICGLLVGLAMYDIGGALQRLDEVRPAVLLSPWENFRALAGMLLIVQGFETSRYLGGAYDPATRIRTMRLAQWVSGLVYLTFVGLALPLVPDLPEGANETAIIHLSSIVSSALPPLLVFAAVMSQFSAAVADTVGGGGLIASASSGRFGSNRSYAAIAVVAVSVNWLTEIFDIVALASRAFALYYCLQCVEACVVAHSRVRSVTFAALAALLLLVAVFAIPVA